MILANQEGNTVFNNEGQFVELDYDMVNDIVRLLETKGEFNYETNNLYPIEITDGKPTHYSKFYYCEMDNGDLLKIEVVKKIS